MAQYKIKKGIMPGAPLLPDRFATTPWVVKSHSDRPFVFEGVVQAQGESGPVDCLSAQGFPVVKVGGDRTIYANFLTDENGGSIVERVAVKQPVGAVVV